METKLKSDKRKECAVYSNFLYLKKFSSKLDFNLDISTRTNETDLRRDLSDIILNNIEIMLHDCVGSRVLI